MQKFIQRHITTTSAVSFKKAGTPTPKPRETPTPATHLPPRPVSHEPTSVPPHGKGMDPADEAVPLRNEGNAPQNEYGDENAQNDSHENDKSRKSPRDDDVQRGWVQ